MIHDFSEPHACAGPLGEQIQRLRGDLKKLVQELSAFADSIQIPEAAAVETEIERLMALRGDIAQTLRIRPSGGGISIGEPFMGAGTYILPVRMTGQQAISLSTPVDYLDDPNPYRFSVSVLGAHNMMPVTGTAAFTQSLQTAWDGPASVTVSAQEASGKVELDIGFGSPVWDWFTLIATCPITLSGGFTTAVNADTIP